jgi:sec-independent protein translocase protein TatB
MFDFGLGATELMLIAVVALIVVGPKDLPRLMRWIGNAMAKVRALAREFQGHLDEAMRETGLDEVKNGVSKVKEYTVADLDAEFEKLEKEFRETALPDSPPESRARKEDAEKDAEKDDTADSLDENLLDETEREILSLDEDAPGSREGTASGAGGKGAPEDGKDGAETATAGGSGDGTAGESGTTGGKRAS